MVKNKESKKKRWENKARNKCILLDIKPEHNQLFDGRKTGEYKDAWTYLTQSCRDTGKYGLGLYNDFAVIGLFERPVDKKLHFVVTPTGETDINGLDELCKKLYSVSKTPVFVKKLTDQEVMLLSEKGEYVRSVEYPWSDVPVSSTMVNHSEDDNLPEMRINIRALLRDFYLLKQGKQRRGISLHSVLNGYNSFVKSGLEGKLEIRDYDPAQDKKDAQKIIDDFFSDPRKRLLSDPRDYYNMINYMPFGKNGEDYYAKIAFLDGKPTAFMMAEKVRKDTVTINAHMINEKHKGLSTYLYMELFDEIIKSDTEIKYANTGGKEKKSLMDYTDKFQPNEKCQKYWAVYKPTKLIDALNRGLGKYILPIAIAGVIAVSASYFTVQNQLKLSSEYSTLVEGTMACDPNLLFNYLDVFQTEKIRLRADYYTSFFDQEGHLKVIPQNKEGSRYKFWESFTFETTKAFNADEQQQINKCIKQEESLELIGRFKRYQRGRHADWSSSIINLESVVVLDNDGDVKKILDMNYR